MRRIVRAIHEGVFETPRWADFLGRLQAAAGAGYVSIAFRSADPRFRDLDVMRTAGRVFSHDDPQLRLLMDRHSAPLDLADYDRPYTLDDIAGVLGDDAAAYRAYLRGHDVDHVLTIQVREPRGGSCWLSLARAGEDFAPEVAGWLIDLAPHLALATRTLVALEEERMRADIAQEAMHRLNFGWLTFDGDGRVIEIDPEADRMLRTIPALRRCAPGDLFAAEGLRAHLAEMADKPGQRPRAIHLVEEPWLDMLLVPAAFRPVAGGRAPVAVGYVHGVGAAGPDRQDQLIRLFGLTRSEARLALTLTQGRSIAEAGATLGLSGETARTYSKRIYAKTGTRGQADLVRVILTSVVALS